MDLDPVDEDAPDDTRAADPLDVEAKRKRRPHRPPVLGPGRTRSEHLRVRLSNDEFETVWNRAARHGQTLPDWVRNRLIREAE